jgi:hypothetical protein
VTALFLTFALTHDSVAWRSSAAYHALVFGVHTFGEGLLATHDAIVDYDWFSLTLLLPAPGAWGLTGYICEKGHVTVQIQLALA